MPWRWNCASAQSRAGVATMAKANNKIDDRAAELRDLAGRIANAIEELKSTGFRKSLLVHAIYMETNRGVHANSKVGKRQIESVLEALDDIESLLFEDVEDGPC